MKKLATGVLAAMIVFSLAYIGSVKAEGPEKATIAALDYEYTDLATDTDTVSGEAVSLDLKESKYGNKTDGYKFTTGTGTLFASITGDKTKSIEWSSETDVTTGEDMPSAEYKMGGDKQITPVMAATKKNMWTEGTIPYFEIRVSTKGYKDVEISAYVGASKKGPRDYRLTYAVGDSTEFTALTEDSAKISLAKNKEMTKISGTLPAAANDKELVKVRIEVASMESVSSTAESPVYLYTNSSSGEAAINHIEIKGADVKAASATATASAPCGPHGVLKPTPTPTPQNDKVPAVKKIKLNKKKLTLKKGKKYQLKVTVKPNNKKTVKLAKSKLKWKSSNKKVVTVSKNGKLKAKKKGKATITVKYSKKIKATCKVTVKKK